MALQLTMFLVEKQKARFDNYENLPPREKATFTFRILDKIRMFLDEIPEVNQVLEKIPRKSREKAFREEHIYALFDLLEKAIIGVGILPIAPSPPPFETPYVMAEFKQFEGDDFYGSYKIHRRATPDEIMRLESIKAQIKRLEELVTDPYSASTGLSLNEMRSRFENPPK
jgi:hypothetical protein